MASSGIGVHPGCLQDYQTLQLGKKLKYIIFKFSPDNKEIITEKTSESDKYDDFIADLPEDQCRYAVYDFHYQKEGAGQRNKVCFFLWNPDAATIKSRMLTASSKDALRKSFNGIHFDIQGSDYSEVSYESVLEKVSKSF
ncbi:hypothetical protein F5878DRAFT_572039 [Lentinula raphanica]|uniref:Cofilin n=1 Tax=Lentinula raphanica TaxID=153919 RepID=A0AA38PM65_9AGAR|nr:hypothetical protein F5880DRAFT_1184149 [Lentinula raphanica]KAJ3845203.1 hypothetical protein F5878DRAFT_572039 [Lentinula raphanica]